MSDIQKKIESLSKDIWEKKQQLFPNCVVNVSRSR